jgi:hypothetical protein
VCQCATGFIGFNCQFDVAALGEQTPEGTGFQTSAVVTLFELVMPGESRARAVAWSEVLAAELQRFLEVSLNYPRLFIAVAPPVVNATGGIDVLVTITRLPTTTVATITRQRLLLLNVDTGATGNRAILRAKMHSRFLIEMGETRNSSIPDAPEEGRTSDDDSFSDENFFVIYVVCGVLACCLCLVIVSALLLCRNRQESTVYEAKIATGSVLTWPQLPELRPITVGEEIAGGWNTTTLHDGGLGGPDGGASTSHYYPTANTWDGKQATLGDAEWRGVSNSSYHPNAAS